MVKRTTFNIIVISLFFALLSCGCQQQSQSDTKKDRLLGNKNIHLEKDLEEQAKLLEQCQQEKKQMMDNSNKIAEFLMEIHSESIKENDALKARIAELESQAGSSE